MPDAMGLDHCFVAVRDLAEAARKMRALGFTVSGRNVHTNYGSANHLVVLDGAYIELIGLADASMSHTPEYVSLQRYLVDGEGWRETAFEPGPVEAARSALAGRGVATDPCQIWERQADLGNGTFGRAKFSTANIIQSATSRHAFFLCHHHNPSAVYSPVQMRHPNGAFRIAEGALFVESLDELAPLLEGLFPGVVRRSPGGLEVELPGTRLTFRQHEQILLRSELTILVRDVGLTQSLLKNNGVRFSATDDRIAVSADETPGFDLIMTSVQDRPAETSAAR